MHTQPITTLVVGVNPSAIVDAVQRELSQSMPLRPLPPLWDGRAAERIADILETAVT